jgi:hypothetical protein
MTTKISISDLQKQASKTTESPVTSSGGESIIYSFQLKEKLTTDEQKKKRKKLRKDFLTLSSKVKNANKKSLLNDSKLANTEIVKEFIKFYKDTYILQDFSFESCGSKLRNEAEIENVKFALMTAQFYLQSETKK